MKEKEYDAADWAIRDKYFSEHDIHAAIRDGIPTSMQDELYDKI